MGKDIAEAFRKSTFGCEYFLDNGRGPQRDEQFVMADNVVAVATLVRGAADDVLGGAIMADHVEGDGGEIINLVAEVAGDRERFQEHFRQDDRGADVEDDAAFELGDHGGELLEVEVVASPSTPPSVVGC